MSKRYKRMILFEVGKMDTYLTIKERRSIRKFKDKSIPSTVLEKCVNAGRLSPSAANKQPLKFITITKKLEEVFSCTKWAGYLDWEPDETEMPRAYIGILKKEDYGWDIDAGIAAQSICLTAWNEGVGSCILGSIDREKLQELLPIPSDHKIVYLVALGYPDEEPEVVQSDEKVEYYHEGGVLKVPKRPIEGIWIEY